MADIFAQVLNYLDDHIACPDALNRRRPAEDFRGWRTPVCWPER